MTQEELSITKEKLRKISLCEAAINSAKGNIQKYELLKAEFEFALISTNSNFFKDFMEFIRKNNISYDDISPIYCRGTRKNEFFDNLISDNQKFIDKQEAEILNI